MTGGYDLLFAFSCGMALGVFFSVNLWSSVKRMADSRTPWYVLFGNFVLRMSVVLLGFFLVMDHRWERMVAALLGFLLVREIMMRRLGRRPGTP